MAANLKACNLCKTDNVMISQDTVINHYYLKNLVNGTLFIKQESPYDGKSVYMYGPYYAWFYNSGGIWVIGDTVGTVADHVWFVNTNISNSVMPSNGWISSAPAFTFAPNPSAYFRYSGAGYYVGNFTSLEWVSSYWRTSDQNYESTDNYNPYYLTGSENFQAV